MQDSQAYNYNIQDYPHSNTFTLRKQYQLKVISVLNMAE
jgi:hypothetical protein